MNARDVTKTRTKRCKYLTEKYLTKKYLTKKYLTKKYLTKLYKYMILIHDNECKIN